LVKKDVPLMAHRVYNRHDTNGSVACLPHKDLIEGTKTATRSKTMSDRDRNAGLSGTKWSMAGLMTNLIGGNGDNVCRAIVSNPDLLKELSDERLNRAKEVLKSYKPQGRAKRLEKSSAEAQLNTVIGDRVATGSQSNFDGGTTVQTDGPTEVKVTDNETVIKTEEQTTTVEHAAGEDFEAAAQVHEETTGKDATTGQPVKNNGNVKPDAFGITVKGDRICKECGIKESETLKRNSRYSFCKGMCVNCYNKVARGKGTGGKEENLTQEQIQGRIQFYTDMLNKVLANKTATEGGTQQGDSNVSEISAESDGAPQVTSGVTEELATVSQPE
jgi:hypothetical protein